MTQQYVRPISLAETNQRNINQNLYQLTNFVNTNVTANVLNYGAIGDGVTDDATAIGRAITAVSNAGGGTVLFPVPMAHYLVKSGIVVPNTVSLAGASNAVNIYAGANGITSLIKITSNNLSSVRHLTLFVNGFDTTNGIEFAPTIFGNNWLTAEDVYCVGFVNNFLNSNADFFRILNCFSQNATGFSVRSTFSATGSRIDGLKVLGDNAGIYYSPGATTTEGAIIVNSDIIVSGTGKAIQLDQSLLCQIANVNVDGQVYFNGTTNAHAFVVINGLYISPSSGSTDTIGLLVDGNMADLFLRGITCAGFSGQGIKVTSASTLLTAQRVYIDAFRGIGNGTGAGSADLLIDATLGGVGPVYVSNSVFESVGGSVVSVLETTGTGSVTSQYEANNFYFSTAPSAAGAVPAPNLFASVAQLPSAASHLGWRFIVNNSSLPSSGNFGVAVTSSTNNFPVPVFSDGTTWRIG